MFGRTKTVRERMFYVKNKEMFPITDDIYKIIALYKFPSTPVYTKINYNNINPETIDNYLKIIKDIKIDEFVLDNNYYLEDRTPNKLIERYNNNGEGISIISKRDIIYYLNKHKKVLKELNSKIIFTNDIKEKSYSIILNSDDIKLKIENGVLYYNFKRKNFSIEAYQEYGEETCDLDLDIKENNKLNLSIKKNNKKSCLFIDIIKDEK